MECADARREANNVQISQRQGPFYLHQQRRTIMKAHQRILAAERATQ